MVATRSVVVVAAWAVPSTVEVVGAGGAGAVRQKFHYLICF